MPRKQRPAAPVTRSPDAPWHPTMCHRCHPWLLNPNGQGGPPRFQTCILFTPPREPVVLRGVPLLDILALKSGCMDQPAEQVLLNHPGPIWFQLNLNGYNLHRDRPGFPGLMEGNCEHFPNSRFFVAWYIAKAFQQELGDEGLLGLNLISFETTTERRWKAVVKRAPPLSF